MSDHSPRILVVDDVAQNVHLLEAVLEAHGYDVVSATDGETASSSPYRRSRISYCSPRQRFLRGNENPAERGPVRSIPANRRFHVTMLVDDAFPAGSSA